MKIYCIAYGVLIFAVHLHSTIHPYKSIHTVYILSVITFTNYRFPAMFFGKVHFYIFHKRWYKLHRFVQLIFRYAQSVSASSRAKAWKEFIKSRSKTVYESIGGDSCMAKLQRRSYNPLFIKHAKVWSLPITRKFAVSYTKVLAWLIFSLRTCRWSVLSWGD